MQNKKKQKKRQNTPKLLDVRCERLEDASITAWRRVQNPPQQSAYLCQRPPVPFNTVTPNNWISLKLHLILFIKIHFLPEKLNKYEKCRTTSCLAVLKKVWIRPPPEVNWVYSGAETHITSKLCGNPFRSFPAAGILLTNQRTDTDEHNILVKVIKKLG